MNRATLAGALLVLTIVALTLFVWRRAQPSPAGAGHDAPQPAQAQPVEPDAGAAPGLGAAVQPDAPAEPAAPAAAANVQPSDAAPARALPMSFIRRDYEREPRDAAAAAAEARIRELYAATPSAEGVLREVRCTKSVCKIDARYSQQLHGGYNDALLKVIAAFSNEVSFEPGGPPDGQTLPMTLFVRRTRAVGL